MNRSILILLVFLVVGGILIWAVRSNFSLLSFGEGPLPALPGGKIPGKEIERLNLQKEMDEEVAALGVTENASLYYKNLVGGYEVTIAPDKPWIPASMVKAFIVTEAFRQKGLRLINFDSRVTIKADNVVATELESRDYQPLREGVKATIRELIEAMVTQSDNTAFNSLVDVLDRRNVTSNLRRLGLNDTVVGEKLSLSDEQYALDTLVPGRQPNRTTARDFGYLFNLLYQGKIEGSGEILAIFKKQKLADMIPALLPEKVVVAHKTGAWPPYFHDGGIVYRPNEPFVLAIFTNNNDPTVVAKLAKVAYFNSRDVLGASTVRGFLERLLR